VYKRAKDIYMDSLLQADIFFFVTTTIVVAFAVVVLIILLFVLSMVNDVRHFVSRVRREGDAVMDGVGKVRHSVEKVIARYSTKGRNKKAEREEHA
jgi:hypothetical protein